MSKELKTTSLKINPELWQEAKIYCIRNNLKLSDWLEKIIKENLKKK